MTTMNLLCLGGGVLIGAALAVLLGVFFSNSHLPTATQEHNDAAFGPGGGERAVVDDLDQVEARVDRLEEVMKLRANIERDERNLALHREAVSNISRNLANRRKELGKRTAPMEAQP